MAITSWVNGATIAMARPAGRLALLQPAGIERLFRRVVSCQPPRGTHPDDRSTPFGLTAQEMNGWLYYGGGLELWTELYAQFGLVPAPAGNTGVQMGGWFNKEINSVAT
jgi:hypothetical protein